MQPSMKKVHSVDYAGQQQEQQQQQADRSIRSTMTSAGRNAPLMHSVSIVVELANENQGSALMFNEPADESYNSQSDRSRDGDQNKTTNVSLMGSKTPKQANDGVDPQTRVESSPAFEYRKNQNIDEDSEGKEEEEEEGGDNDDDDDDDQEDDNNIGRENNDDNGEEDDDEEATEAASECLSSELARKVVIVDEADKILLWNRAHSAEPKFDLADRSSSGEEMLPRPSTSCGSQAAGSLPLGRLATLRSNTINYEGRSSQDAQLWWHQQQQQQQRQQQQQQPTNRGSNGELAERGELSKLSMRRYTHHQVQYSSPSSCSALRNAINHFTITTAAAATTTTTTSTTTTSSTDDSSSTSRIGKSPRAALLSSQLTADGKFTSSTTATTTNDNTSLSTTARAISPSLVAAKSPAPRTSTSCGTASSTVVAIGGGNCVKNWSQRRQSLQISLLSGGACAANKSLTEEELRGEREFNEQVRIAKSPELFTTLQHHQRHHQQSLAFNNDQRCQSVGGDFVTRTSPTAAGIESDQLPASLSNVFGEGSQVVHPSSSAHHQQRHQQIKQHSTQRRVSFSSIDPILVNAEPVRSRASVAYYPATTNRQHQLELNLTGSITGASPPFTPDSLDEATSRIGSANTPTKESTASSTTSRPPPPHVSCLKLNKLKRHSLATNHYPLSSEFLSLQQQSQHKILTESHDNWAQKRGLNSENWSLSQQREEYHKDTPLSIGRRLPTARKLSISYDTIGRPMTSSTTANISTTLSGTATSKTSKMNDNIISQREVPSRIDSLGAQARTFSATLEGQDMADEPQVSSSTTSTPTGGPQTSGSASDSAKAQQRDVSKVQSIMANAKLRQEEFARLLEEHEQIVNEIHRVETKISSSQTNLQQQQQQQQQQENK